MPDRTISRSVLTSAVGAARIGIATLSWAPGAVKVQDALDALEGHLLPSGGATNDVPVRQADGSVSWGAPPGAPSADETVAGIAERATQTEVNTGTDDLRFVTPLKLAGRTATETRTGVAEIATQAEVDGSTDDSRFVTALKLAVRVMLHKIRGGTFNVKDYGATGNGATDDTTTIRAAITACNAAGGGVVYFPPGTYKVTVQSDGAALMCGNAFLEGDSRLSTRIAMASATGHTLQFGTTSTPSAYAGVRRINLKPSVARSTAYQSTTANGSTGSGIAGDGQYEIYAPNFVHMTIDEVQFWGKLTAAETGGAALNTTHRCMRFGHPDSSNGGVPSQSINLRISYVYGVHYDELARIVNTFDTWIHTNSTSPSRAAGNTWWIDGGCDAVVFSPSDYPNASQTGDADNKHSDKTGTCLKLSPQIYTSGTGWAPPRYVFAHDIYFDSHFQALQIDDARECTFQNCQFTAIPGSAAYLPGGEDIVFDSCRFTNSGAYGAHVTSATSNVEFNNCRAISNCELSNASYVASHVAYGTYHGFFFGPNVTKFKVRNCRAYNAGLTRYPGQQGYGLYLSSGCDQFAIQNNDFSGNYTGDIGGDATALTPGPTRQFFNNYGRTANGTAVFSGDGTTTAFNIAHGLGFTPTIFNAVPASIGAAGQYWVTATSTNLVVTYTVARVNAANNVTLKWRVDA